MKTRKFIATINEDGLYKLKEVKEFDGLPGIFFRDSFAFLPEDICLEIVDGFGFAIIATAEVTEFVNTEDRLFALVTFSEQNGEFTTLIEGDKYLSPISGEEIIAIQETVYPAIDKLLELLDQEDGKIPLATFCAPFYDKPEKN